MQKIIMLFMALIFTISLNAQTNTISRDTIVLDNDNVYSKDTIVLDNGIIYVGNVIGITDESLKLQYIGNDGLKWAKNFKYNHLAYCSNKDIIYIPVPVIDNVKNAQCLITGNVIKKYVDKEVLKYYKIPKFISIDSEKMNNLKLPSFYLKTSSDLQVASLMLASVGLLSTCFEDMDPGISAGFGVLSVLFYITGLFQLHNAGEALSRIQIENNGIIIKL